jgi:hypothetical protein
MNLKIFVTQHWKAVAIAVSVGMVVVSVACAWWIGDPIDSPCGP